MNRRDFGARLSVYCTSAVARNLRVPVLALFFRAFFIACGYARLPEAAFNPPGGLPGHVAVIRGRSIQAKLTRNSVFMRLHGDKKISRSAVLGKFFCAKKSPAPTFLSKLNPSSARSGARTLDTLIKSQVLYQLS